MFLTRGIIFLLILVTITGGLKTNGWMNIVVFVYSVKDDGGYL